MKLLLTFILALSINAFAATDTQLEQAYAKEFAYLKAQKNMLTLRLKSVKSEQTDKLKKAKKDLQILQNRVLQRNVLSEKLSNNLFRSQQNALNMTDDTAIIEAVMMQSTNALKAYNINIPVDKNDYQAALKKVFVNTDLLVTTLSSVTKEEGKFYTLDGKQKDGTIVKIGNIASYGLAQDIASALVPAGEGKLKVWNSPESAQTANAINNSQDIQSLNIFIYENAALEIEDVKEKTILDVINSAGIIGWVIVVLGAIGLILALLRIMFLASASSSTSNLAKSTLIELLEKGTDGALAYLKTKKGSTARVLKATIRNLDRDREHIEDIVAESILHESGRLDKFGSVLLVIAAVSPLLGLLGTVTGMIATFDIITEFGTGDPKLLSGGISIALVTTELGLIVAIPILMIGNLLGGWAERVKDSMEHSALHLINEYNQQK